MGEKAMTEINKFERDTVTAAGPIAAPTRKRWSPIRWIELTLLVSGIVLAGFFLAARLESHFRSQAAIKAFESAESIAVSPETPNTLEFASEEPDFSGWDEGRVRAYKQTVAQRSDIPLAVLAIEKIHLIAPLFEGTDGLTLNHAVGHITGTARPGEAGNIGIAGHRDGFFRGLKEIKPGDTIELRTRSGKDTYTVDHVQIVTPRDVSVLESQPEPSLTLVTCYPFYHIGSAPERFVVTAYLTQHVPAGATTLEIRPNSQTHSTTLEEQ
jgi:sortase A